ncbi:MAG: MFS transporter [Chloroflexota bacterium]
MESEREVSRFSLSAAANALSSLPWAALRLTMSIAFLSVAAMLNFAPLLPEVQGEFDISNTWAATLTSATVLTHTLLQMPAGQIVDSLGGRKSALLGMTLIGLAVTAGGFAPNLAPLLLSRLVLGAGTAIAFVAGLTITNRLVTKGQRVLAQSMYGVGASAGTMFVLLFSERLSRLGGWRAALIAEGIGLLIVGWAVASRLDGRSYIVQSVNLSWGVVLREGPLYLLGLAHVITYGVFTAVTTWVVTFLHESHGIGLEWAGPLAAIFTVAAVAGRLTGGLFSAGRERTFIVLTCAVTAVSVILLPLLSGVVPALLALVAFGWAVSVPFGSLFSYVSLLWHRPAAGRELALINFLANIGALIFPLVVGLALDQSESWVIAFGALGVFVVLGTLVVARWLPNVAE